MNVTETTWRVGDLVSLTAVLDAADVDLIIWALELYRAHAGDAGQGARAKAIMQALRKAWHPYNGRTK